MYVEPNSTIRLLHGVNLDPTYQHTIYFNTAQDQANYFIGKTKHNLSKYYFQRKDRGVVKVNIDIGELYDCNYMMFRNDSFSNKWFYAFITNVEYANNGMSYVYFMIDIMQTWFFDYDIQESFVLRDHAMTDAPGDNIVPEEVTADVQYINSKDDNPIIAYKSFLITSTRKLGDGRWVSNEYQDAFSRVIRPYDYERVQNIGDLENALQPYKDDGQMDGVLGVIPCYGPVTCTLNRPASIGNYVPRNKKLLTGQYCKYIFELAGNKMEVPMDAVPSPTVRTYPNNISRDDIGHTSYRVFLEQYNAAEYPTSMGLEIPVQVEPWAYNAYANQVALHHNSTAMMLSREEQEKARDLANVGLGAVSNAFANSGRVASSLYAGNIGGAIGGVVGASQDMVNSYISGYELLNNIDKHSEVLSRHRENLNAPATGASVNSNYLMEYEQMKLSGYVWTVLPQDAERIDKYFDMYGYAQNVMKRPNRNGRPHWNYVRTSGLEFHSRCPQEDMMNIVKIYENGITFWNNGDEIGDYTLPNNIQ